MKPSITYYIETRDGSNKYAINGKLNVFSTVQEDKNPTHIMKTGIPPVCNDQSIKYLNENIESRFTQDYSHKLNEHTPVSDNLTIILTFYNTEDKIQFIIKLAVVTS